MRERALSDGRELFETWGGCNKENYSSQVGINDGGGNGTV